MDYITPAPEALIIIVALIYRLESSYIGEELIVDTSLQA
jgi:hypothetical protein